jgi:hypothetical protein
MVPTPPVDTPAPEQGETIEGSLDTLLDTLKVAPPEPETASDDTPKPGLVELQVQLEEAQAKIAELESEQPIQDQEVRSSIEQPAHVDADVAVDRQPEPPRRLVKPGVAEQAECSAMHESNPSDALVRYRNAIKDLLATMSQIAGATARPSDELSAIAQLAVTKHSKALY